MVLIGLAQISCEEKEASYLATVTNDTNVLKTNETVTIPVQT